jgi:hypothetical protein
MMSRSDEYLIICGGAFIVMSSEAEEINVKHVRANFACKPEHGKWKWVSKFYENESIRF